MSRIESGASTGNAFEVIVRGLDGRDLAALRANAPLVREHGAVNYFDEQRFGNLRHNQGWIALDLMRGEYEKGLKSLLTSVSPFDDGRSRRFKEALEQAWGDWVACREAAGRFGQRKITVVRAGPLDGRPDGTEGHKGRLPDGAGRQGKALWNGAGPQKIRPQFDDGPGAIGDLQQGCSHIGEAAIMAIAFLGMATLVMG